MKVKICFSVLVLFLLFSFNLPTFAKVKDYLYQYSTINALLKGFYDSSYSFAELKKHGNFGLGTFSGINGEMIALDNSFYQVKSTGEILKVNDKQTSPFAMVVNFNSDNTFQVTNQLNIEELNNYIDSVLPSKNLFYAFKVTGVFKNVRARSVSGQTKPYPDFAEVIKNQSIFNFDNIEGTLVGFRSPEYMNMVTVPGYHWHFISKDRTKGGHVLNIIGSKLTIYVDKLSKFDLVLPGDQSFYGLMLNVDKSNEIKKFEK